MIEVYDFGTPEDMPVNDQSPEVPVTRDKAFALAQAALLIGVAPRKPFLKMDNGANVWACMPGNPKMVCLGKADPMFQAGYSQGYGDASCEGRPDMPYMAESARDLFSAGYREGFKHFLAEAAQ